MASPDEISEDGLEAVVRTLHSPDVEPSVDDDLRQLAIEGVRLARSHEQRVRRGHLDRDDVVHPGERLREVPRPRGRDPDRVRMLVDERSDRVQVPGGDPLPVVDQDDVLRDPFDLVQDVRRHQDVAALPGEPGDRAEDLDAADGIRAGKRLVQNQDLRIVGERLGELRPLPHPSAVPMEGAIFRRRQADDLERLGRLRPRVRGPEAIEAQERLDEPRGRHPAVPLFVPGPVPDPRFHRDVVPRVLAEHPDCPLVRSELADQEFEQGALPRAVRADEPGDARAERRREAVQAEHLPVPFREVAGLDDAGHPDTTSTAFIRRYVAKAARTVTPRRIASASGQSIGPQLTPYAPRATARKSSHGDRYRRFGSFTAPADARIPTGIVRPSVIAKTPAAAYPFRQVRLERKSAVAV